MSHFSPGPEFLSNKTNYYRIFPCAAINIFINYQHRAERRCAFLSVKSRRKETWETGFTFLSLASTKPFRAHFASDAKRCCSQCCSHTHGKISGRRKETEISSVGASQNPGCDVCHAMGREIPPWLFQASALSSAETVSISIMLTSRNLISSPSICIPRVCTP